MLNNSTKQKRAFAPVLTDMNFEELRQSTISAYEVPSLFETVAENNIITDDHDDFETNDGTPIGAYASPLSLWEMKSKLYKDVPRPRGLWSRMKWSVISHMCDQNNIETRNCTSAYLHPNISFMSSKPDMEGSTDGGKTWCPIISYNIPSTMISTWKNAAGHYKAPEAALLTAHHHMAVSGASHCYIVTLFGGVQTEIFRVARDEILINDITDTIISFWSCVTEKRRPQHSGSRDARVLSRLCAQIDPNANIKDFRGNNRIKSLHEEKVVLSKEIRSREKRVKEISAELTAAMDGCSAAIIDDQTMYGWINVEKKEVPAYTKPGFSYIKAKKIKPKNAGTALSDLLNR